MIQLATLYEQIETRVGRRVFKMVRYVFSGGTAAASNVIVLYLLVQFGGVYYLYASILAFIFSLAVSFTLHKFLTFRNTQKHAVRGQFARYVVVVLGNLALNTGLVYLLVEKADAWYVLAQAAATLVIAVTSYIGYHYFVFREHPPLSL